jgi:phosphoribosylformimino-5-aminoimidazole carboxamide ribotide isomerase
MAMIEITGGLSGAQFQASGVTSPKPDARPPTPCYHQFPALEALSMILFPLSTSKTASACASSSATWSRPPSTTTIPARRRKPSRTRAFEWLHVVDLNGAFAGESVNGAAVEAILKATKNPVQLGGGIRSLDHIEAGCRQGPRPCHPRHRCGARPGAGHRSLQKVSPARSPSASTPRAARLPSRAGRKPPNSASIELAKKFEGAGVAAIIYTDIDRDGILAGINWDSTLDLAEAVSIPVIASGGLASMADIAACCMPDAAKARRRHLRPRAV